MKISVKKSTFNQLRGDTLVLVPFFQNGKKIQFNSATKSFEKKLDSFKKQFKSDFKSTFHFENFIFLGLGEEKDFSSIKLLQALEMGVKRLKACNVAEYHIYLSSFEWNQIQAHIIIRALGNVLYSLSDFKTNKSDTESHVMVFVSSQKEVTEFKKALSYALVVNEATDFVRTLGNYPPNELTAQRLADFSKKMAQKAKISCEVWGRKQLEKNGFGALLSVNNGSFDEPAFVILEYNKLKKNLPLICLVGKGVTFDTGGINLKPSKNLEDMKFDMCGAAMMLGVTQAVATLKLPLRVVTLIPSTDNRPGNKATLPSAIVKSHSGKTIEILNTDAEGRLILCDALSFSKKFKPDAIIDAATLTGACVISLGSWYAGLLGNDENLLDKIKKAADDTAERVWPLPLSHDHAEALKSQFADIANISNANGGGTSTAAKFLEQFLPEKTPWVHLDIAGTAWTNEKTATGYGVALITRVLENWAG
ncbi:MAG: leucyl aminopeptidase [Deltaproteobacteria bacterium]|nr:leucyl aminopeptidase [Deltaproteobacteria bacterium]